MARTLCPDARRVTLMAAAACVALLAPAAWTQVAVIVTAGLAGLVLLPQPPRGAHDPLPLHVSPRAGVLWLALFAALLVVLPFAVRTLRSDTLAVVDAFFRTGALVFGGGHVVLPLLQAAVVAPGWVGDAAFLAGYGVAQAVPGPLFTFSAFLGASLRNAPNGWLGGTIALVSIFAPSFLLVAGTAPFWERLRRSTRMQAALAGVNAAVVGLLLAALYHPVWTDTIVAPRDLAAALVAFVALVFWRVPPWAVVIASAALGWKPASRPDKVRGTFHRVKTKSPRFEGFSSECRAPQRRAGAGPYAKFFAAKSQFTMFQNASTNFGRALR